MVLVAEKVKLQTCSPRTESNKAEKRVVLGGGIPLFEEIPPHVNVVPVSYQRFYWSK